MPYVNESVRTKLNGPIDALIEAIVAEAVDSGDELSAAGYLNYAATRMFLSVFRILFPTRKYWHIALITGVLTNIKQEIYRRIAGGFEDNKKKLYGDLEEFEG